MLGTSGNVRKRGYLLRGTDTVVRVRGVPKRDGSYRCVPATAGRPLLDDLLKQVSAVMITGPRASGKTTTATRRATTIVQLGAEAQAAAFAADPDASLRGLREPVLLDEWQEVSRRLRRRPPGRRRKPLP